MHQKFLHCAMRFVYSLIGEGGRASVSIGDGHLPKALTSNHMRTLFRRHLWIGERIVRVGIA